MYKRSKLFYCFYLLSTTVKISSTLLIYLYIYLCSVSVSWHRGFNSNLSAILVRQNKRGKLNLESGNVEWKLICRSSTMFCLVPIKSCKSIKEAKKIDDPVLVNYPRKLKSSSIQFCVFVSFRQRMEKIKKEINIKLFLLFLWSFELISLLINRAR